MLLRLSATALASLLFICQPAASERPEVAAGETLQQFLSAAVEYSPRLGMAEARRQISTARAAAAFGSLLPQVSVTGTVTENRREALGQMEEFRGERYALQLNQVVFNWEAVAAMRRARRLEKMQHAEYGHELSLLFTQVADHYLNVLQAQDGLESVRSELDAVTSQVAQIQSLHDRQLAKITDLLQARASLAAVRADQIRLRGELDLAREALRAASGLEVGSLHTFRDDAQIPQQEEDVENWVQRALDNNQQLRAARLAVDAAELGVSQAKGVLMPNVSFVAQRQNSNVGFDNTPIRETDTSYLGLSASMPLFSGGTKWVAIREARGNQALAERELRLAELESSARVRSAYLQLQYGESLEEAARAAVESATLAAAAMQQGFALGTVTHVDVLNALRERFRAERDLAQVRYDNVRQFVMLRHESGTLTQHDMTAVSSWFDKTHSLTGDGNPDG